MGQLDAVASHELAPQSAVVVDEEKETTQQIIVPRDSGAWLIMDDVPFSRTPRFGHWSHWPKDE